MVYVPMLIKELERWLSWSKAHDWKSCVRVKPTVGSNPTLSVHKNGGLYAKAACFLSYAARGILHGLGNSARVPAAASLLLNNISKYVRLHFHPACKMLARLLPYFAEEK